MAIKRKRQFRITNSGFTLIETLIYMAIFVMAVVIIIYGMLGISRVFGKNRIERQVSLAAEVAVERILREIRLACSVSVTAQSITLTTFADFVAPDTTNCAVTGSTMSRIIALSAQNITVGGTDILPSNVHATSLQFTSPDDGGTGKPAVRVVVNLQGGSDTKYETTRQYFGTAILRGPY